MHGSAGYTLVEMIAVMAITAIVAAMVGVFLRLPLKNYQDIERRAAITDAADTAFAFLKRDLQMALPNSVRVRVSADGTTFYLELLRVRAAGRYRAQRPGVAVPAAPPATCADTNADGMADENVLLFGAADSCFTTLGAIPNLNTIVPNADYLVLYNLGPGFSDADAYATPTATTGNRTLATSVNAGNGGENVITFSAHTFNVESPTQRFHVISGPVSYVCNTTAGTLRRVSGYAISATQPTPADGTGVLLAQGLSGCTITYDQNVVNVRNGIVSMWLNFADRAGGTSQRIFQQIQVRNDP